jgi:hypothetical protein
VWEERCGEASLYPGLAVHSDRAIDLNYEKIMSEIDKVTGQRIDYKERNDNAPPSYSAPSEQFKKVLRVHANQNCSRCGGTGYIGSFKSIASGRCFLCLPDEWWNGLLGELRLTGTDDVTGRSVCEIRYVTSNIYPSAGYIVTKVGLPPIESTPIFSTEEEACNFAHKVYGV